MVTESAIDKKLSGIENLCTMLLEECRKTRIELGLVQASAPRKGKGLDEKTKQRVITKRNMTALRKQ